MVKYFYSGAEDRTVKEIDKLTENCWIYMEAPTAEEISDIVSATSVPENFLKAVLDEEEAAHLDSDDGVSMVIVDIPKMKAKEDSWEIYTVPLAIIQSESYIITVCIKPTSVLKDIYIGRIKNVDTSKRTRLLYQIMFNNSVRFLYYLRQIDRASDSIQTTLSKSMQNKELLQLLSLQKSLVFFSASLTANDAVIQKIAANMKRLSEDERDILEDVIIENKQALEMCSVYREIIKSSMDAFAAVVNNNQNIVMKFLAAVTIILSIPMVISGYWGMNTGVPFEGSVLGFWITVTASVLLSVITIFIMAKKKMM